MWFSSSKEEYFKFVSLKTYAWDRTINNKRKFRSVFDRSELNYLSVAFEFYNKKFDEKDWKTVITFKAFTLKNVLKSTSQNKSLCDEYNLIKDSQIALENNEFRKSIFECASALELCLTNVLKRKLKVNNEKLKTHILKMNNSIEKKRKLLETIDIQLPPYNYQKDVSQIRNRAIHAGVDVSEKEAENAFAIVKQALDNLITNKLI